MRHHYRLSQTKQQYRDILAQARRLLDTRLSQLRKDFHCTQCDSASPIPLEDGLHMRHSGCGYIAWQKAALQMIEQELGREILLKLQQVEAYKNTFDCHMCGMCCRLASSEATYEQLQARAREGDEFARQFTSVFLPYASRGAARAKYPEVVAAVLAEAAEEEASGEERIYFYHCPYVGEDNRCTIFGTDKRPGICASYPETPLAFVYEKCAWKPWKDETHPETLMAHALLALCTDASDKLKQALGQDD